MFRDIIVRCLVQQEVIVSTWGYTIIHIGELTDKIHLFNMKKRDALNIAQCTHDIPHMNHGIPLMYS